MTVGNVKRGISREPGPVDDVLQGLVQYAIDYLIVGGGASGGDIPGNDDRYGGGGGGQVLTATGYLLNKGQVYGVTVAAQSLGANLDGYHSAFGSITAIGGQNGDASAGGVSGNGFAGGANVGAAGGGGGGAGGVGGAGSPGTSTGGSGGLGVSSSITGAAVFYGGGGGGGSTLNPGVGQHGGGNGEAGGGTSGNPLINATNGQANTGGGGGSGSGSGGSGVVILRIPTADYSGVTTGSPIVTTDGSFKVIKFTANGSYTA